MAPRGWGFAGVCLGLWFCLSTSIEAQEFVSSGCQQELRIPKAGAGAEYSPGTILAVPDGHALAHTSRAIQIAEQLRELGYRVQFATDGKYVPMIEKAGFRCEPHLTLDPKHVMEVSRCGRADYYSEEFLHRCVAEDCALLERVKPQLVLSDFRFSMSTSAEVMRVPHAVTLNSLWTDHFSGRLTAPEGTALGKLMGKTLVSLLSPYLLGVVKSLTLRYDNRAHNKVRRDYGLPPKRNLLDTIAAGDLNLLADIPSFGPTKNLPENFVYVGPIVWQPDIPLPSWYDELDAERPTLYVSMGSTGDPRMFEKVAEVFKDSPYQCLLTTANLVEMPKDTPSNIKVVDFAPGSEMMAKADLVVCQGGNGTVYQALRAGLPILGYPTMHDQHFNMDQVERLKMGTRMSIHPFDPKALRREVERMFGDLEGFAERGRALQAEFERYPGERAAAKAIDQFLRARAAAIP